MNFPRLTFIFLAFAAALSACGPARLKQTAAPVELPASGAVLYLSPIDAPDVWRITADGQRLTQVTATGGKVYDFGVSADGARVAYAAYNELRGTDLWEAAGGGAKPRRLLACGADLCHSPYYSPDGKRLAYSRARSSGLPGEGQKAPAIWLLDLNSLSTDILEADPNIGGESPRWSPDGKYLSFYDPISQGIRVVDLEANQGFLLAGGQGGAGSWSADSREVFYSQAKLVNGIPQATISAADVKTQATRSVLSDEKDPKDYGPPAVSPDGKWMALSMGAVMGSSGKQVWLASLDGKQLKAITAEDRYSHGGYAWSKDGSKLAFQRIELGSSQSRPEVMLWDAASGKITLLAQDAAMPQWAP